MTIYDGSEFGALQDAAYVDGEPYDTWLLRKIENNIAHLYVSDPAVTVSRRGGSDLSNASGDFYKDRAICSQGETVFLAVPVWLDVSVNQISFQILARTGYTTGVSVAAYVVDGAMRMVGSLPAQNISDDGNYTVAIWDFDVPVAPAAEGWGIAYLTVRSTILDGTAAQKVVSGVTTFMDDPQIFRADFGGTYEYDPDTSPNPTPSAKQTVLDHCVLTNENTGASVNVFAIEVLSGSEHRLVLDEEIAPGLGGDLTVLGVVPMSYMQLRSWTIKVHRRYEIRTSELLAERPTRGLDASRQAEGIRRVRTRKRMIAAGPQGYYPPDRSTTQGKHPRIFPTAFSRDPGVQIVYTLFNEAVRCPYPDGTIEFVGLFYADCANANGDGTSDWDIELTDGTVTASGTYTIKSHGSVTETIGNRNGSTWLGLTARTMGNLSNGQNLGLADPYPVREGQFPRNEITSLTRVSVRLPVTSAPDVIRLNLTAQFEGTSENLAVRSTSRNYHKLLLVGYAIYFIPDAP